jgi:outer membrane protein OmpA-like peptidoglycan-associated protein
MRLRYVVATAIAALFASACATTQSHAQHAAEDAEANAREAREDARQAREETAKAQRQWREAREAQAEADQNARLADERAAQAEARAAREVQPRTYPRIGATEVQPSNAVAPAEVRYSVLFPPNSAELTAYARPKLDEVARALRERPRPASIVVQGFTDASGDETHNVQLSQQRADAVAHYLESQGVGGDKISTQAFGSTVPANRELTSEQRAFDRRVDIVLR